MMFKATNPNGSTGVKLPENNDWKYLLRVVVVIGLVGFIVWRLWFSWWVPWGSTEQPASQPEVALAAVEENILSSGQMVGDLEKALSSEMSYFTINETLIVDKETFDVLLCVDEVSREGCTHTAINCSNIGDVDLWLRPEENLKRCNRVLAQSANARYENPDTPPACQKPERLHFSPSAMSYSCK